MKKFLSVICCLAIILSLAACGGGGGDALKGTWEQEGTDYGTVTWNDDWCGGFQDYLEKSDSMLQSAREGHPFDVDSNPLIRLAGIGISLLVGCVAAFVIAVWVSDRMMKSVSAKTEAGAYLTAGSVVITGREDYFTHTTETRTKIEKSSGSGGTTVDSDGFSGKSGKF